MPPRRVLHRLFLASRCFYLWIGVIWAIISFGRISCIKNGTHSDTCYDPPLAYGVSAVSWILFALVLTKSNFGRFRRWTRSQLGKDGGAEQKAASCRGQMSPTRALPACV